MPFLKWAGGKRWLTANHDSLFPAKFGRYIEPFVGSAAVFFHLTPEHAVLSDRNKELINFYIQMKRNWKAVRAALTRHSRNHCAKYYYEERNRKHRAPHERAAQFLYMNRTCWNGLYRVNLRGEFNVPIGTKDAVLLDTDDFEGTAFALQGAKLLASDFEPVLDSAERGDFAFIDPPYITSHNFNGFVKYNEKLFCWDDQRRLSEAVRRARERGVKILLTNADHDSVRELYRGIGSMNSITRSSVIAGGSEFRKPVAELVIKTF